MDTDLVAQALTKAIAYTEQGGAPDINSPLQGKSGEMKSIFQYTPATWKHVSRQVFGEEKPLTADNETYATQQRVKSWLDKGYKPAQILSMWNAGEGEPDAYSGKFGSNTGTHREGDASVGTNSYGVRYDVPNYVKKGLGYAKQFYVEMGQRQQIQQANPQAQSTPQQSQQPNPLTSILAMLRQAKAPTMGGQPAVSQVAQGS